MQSLTRITSKDEIRLIKTMDTVIDREARTDWRHQDVLSTNETLHRLLQDGNRGRTVLTALYLCVLGLCFVVPVFYYIRMHCEERNARRLRELELAGITQALEQSQSLHREESRAAKRKYREERKARINQLFAPVKMELKAENFPHLRGESRGSQGEEKISTDDEGSKFENMAADVEEGVPEIPSPTSIVKSGSIDASIQSIDEDLLFVEVPAPGFQVASSSFAVGQLKQRLVPNVCSICLSNYYAGDQIVWSSNEACEHVFHEKCILQWIMKQREGPMCPCCRRDFVLDPYDLEEEEGDLTGVSLSAPPEAPEYSSDEDDDEAVGGQQRFDGLLNRDTNSTNVGLDVADDTVMATNMEEGLSSSSSSLSPNSPEFFDTNSRSTRNGD